MTTFADREKMLSLADEIERGLSVERDSEAFFAPPLSPKQWRTIVTALRTASTAPSHVVKGWEVQRLNCWVKDRKDRKNISDPVTAKEWSESLKDFTVRARHTAGNLAAHNWNVTIIGDRLLLHTHWSKGKWFDKGSDTPTPMTDAEQAALHPGEPDRYGVPPQPDFKALLALVEQPATPSYAAGFEACRGAAKQAVDQFGAKAAPSNDMEPPGPAWRIARDIHAAISAIPTPATAAEVTEEELSTVIDSVPILWHRHSHQARELLSRFHITARKAL